MLGPMSHGFEMQIERLVPGNASRAVAIKVVTRILVAPAFLGANFGSLALVRGRDAVAECAGKVPAAWKTGTVFWPAFSVVQYRFVPLQYRPAVGSAVGALWSTYLSHVAHDGERPPPPGGEPQTGGGL